VVTPRGGLFGGQLGYNWQRNHVVLGLEGDAQWAHQDSTSCAITCFYDNVTNEFTGSSVRQKLDWFATARARIGWANDGYLLYVTGGPAWGRVSETDTLNFEILPPFAESFARSPVRRSAAASRRGFGEIGRRRSNTCTSISAA